MKPTSQPASHNRHLIELPPGQNVAQLTTLINDRIRELQLILDHLMANPAEEELDMSNLRIKSLADPKDDLDSVNLRTLKKFGGQITTTTTDAVSKDAYTIVFSKDSTLLAGEVTPPFVVGVDRLGAPEEAWICAEVAPTADAAINFTANGARLLTVDLVLPAGSIGPVFATGFRSVSTFAHGTVVLPVITAGGGADLVSLGLVVRRK